MPPTENLPIILCYIYNSLDPDIFTLFQLNLLIPNLLRYALREY